jgi:hypothetical protein
MFHQGIEGQMAIEQQQAGDDDDDGDEAGQRQIAAQADGERPLGPPGARRSAAALAAAGTTAASIRTAERARRSAPASVSAVVSPRCRRIHR